MTPFGHKLRKLRDAAGIKQSEMAEALGISSAYLSALEHGKRGRPTFDLVQRIIFYLNVIWDDADELVSLANLSHPRVIINTAGLSPKATELANRLANEISQLDDVALCRINNLLLESAKKKPILTSDNIYENSK